MLTTWVAIAGALGALARFGLVSAVTAAAAPWAIVAVNVAGSFALGYLVAAAWPSPDVRTAIGTGFLGGFTTFSTFSVQAVTDLHEGRAGRALAYVAASVGLGIAAAAAGWALAR